MCKWLISVSLNQLYIRILAWITVTACEYILVTLCKLYLIKVEWSCSYLTRCKMTSTLLLLHCKSSHCNACLPFNWKHKLTSTKISFSTLTGGAYIYMCISAVQECSGQKNKTITVYTWEESRMEINKTVSCHDQQLRCLSLGWGILLMSLNVGLINSGKKRRKGGHFCKKKKKKCFHLCIVGVVWGVLTEYTQAVVHGHHDHVSVGCEDTGIKHVSGSFHVRASMNKQHHWLLSTVTDIYTHRRKQGIESIKGKKSQ